MWKAFSNLNKTAAGSLRPSENPAGPSTRVIATLVTHPQPSSSSSAVPGHGYGLALACPITAQKAAATSSSPTAATAGLSQLFDHLLSTPVVPAASVQIQPGVISRPASGCNRRFAESAAGFLQSPAVNSGQAAVVEGDSSDLLVRQPKNRVLHGNHHVPGLGFRRPWEKQTNQEEDGYWNFVELVQYSSLLTAGYSILHEQGLDWRTFILPESTCPALIVRNKLSVFAQPHRENYVEQLPLISRQPASLPPPAIPEHPPAACGCVEETERELEERAAQLSFITLSDGEGAPAPQQDPPVAFSSQSSFSLAKTKAEDAQPPATAHAQLTVQQEQYVSVGSKAAQTPPARSKTTAAKAGLTAAEQFELELESMRGVQLLQTGDPRGISVLKRLTVRGSSIAAFYLGMAHEHGAGSLSVNLPRARRYYELAAARGNAEAKYNLAVFHQQGLGGLAASEAEAARLLAEAAASGVLEARRALGLHGRPSKEASDVSSEVVMTC